MPTSQSKKRYGTALILLHWVMLVLLAGVYLTAELQERSDRSDGLALWHYTLGLTVFGLVWVRLVVRLIWPVPEAIEVGWRNILSRITHAALYLLMIGMPLVGWLIVSAEGESVSLLGFELPKLISPDHATAEQLEEVHEIGATIGYWIVGLHAAAALLHQYVLRDGLMGRMLLSARGPT